MRLVEIDCPQCGHVNEYDADESDTIMCDECDGLIFIEDEE